MNQRLPQAVYVALFVPIVRLILPQEWYIHVHLAGCLKTLPPNGLFKSNSFFPAKVAIIKTKGTTIAFSPFLLSSISLLSFSFVSGLVSVILELIAPKSLPFDAFSLK